MYILILGHLEGYISEDLEKAVCTEPDVKFMLLNAIPIYEIMIMEPMLQKLNPQLGYMMAS